VSLVKYREDTKGILAYWRKLENINSNRDIIP